MYLIALGLGLCVSYAGLVSVLPWLLEGRPLRLPRVAARSLIVIVFAAFAAFFVSFQIGDEQWANRFLHVFGGGFVGFLVCVLAARDSGLGIGRTRFFVAAALMVTCMGVANELVEFFLDTYTSLLFSASRIDTWLDLASNAIGVCIAAPFFLPLAPRRREDAPA